MAYPTTYTWAVEEDPVQSGAVAPSTFSAVVAPSFGGQDARKSQFVRAIKFGNVPGGRADFVVHGGPRVYHVNNVQNVYQTPSDKQDLSGVIRNRGTNRNSVPVPTSIRHIEQKSSDRYLNPVFSFTGKYADGYQFVSIDDGTWQVKTGSFIARVGYTGQRMKDTSIIVGGGLDTVFGGLTNVSRYSSGSWTALASLPAFVNWAGSCLLSGTGDLFVHGGQDAGAGNQIDSVGSGQKAFKYILTGSVWHTLPNSLVRHFYGCKVASLSDGRVFVPGGTGFVSGTAALQFTGSEYYNPTTNQWTGTLPVPLDPVDRVGHTLTLLNDGTVLLVGGSGWRLGSIGAPTAHTLRFNPSNDTWQVESSMSFARKNHEAVLLDDGRVMVMGGIGSIDHDGVFAGYSVGTMTGSAIADVEIFDPTARTWTYVGQMREKRSHFASLSFSRIGAEGRVFVCGGQHDTDQVHSAEICDVEYASWKQISTMPTGAFNISAFIAGGSVDQAPFSIVVPGGDVGILNGIPTNDIVLSCSQILITNG